jgi:ATP-dependent RNA helicase SUPV3L1/SUV3
VSELCAPLRVPALTGLSAAGRGLVYQLEQGLGTVSSAGAAAQLSALSEGDHALLDQAGIRIAGRVVYVLAMLDEPSLVCRAALWHAYTGQAFKAHGRQPALVPQPGGSEKGHAVVGYPRFGTLALRADVVERVEAVLERAARRGPFRPPALLAQKLGCSPEKLPGLIVAFGYRAQKGGRFVRSGPRRPPNSSDFRA